MLAIVEDLDEDVDLYDLTIAYEGMYNNERPSEPNIFKGTSPPPPSIPACP